MIKFRVVEVDFSESERLLTEDVSPAVRDAIRHSVTWFAHSLLKQAPQSKLRKFRVDVQYPRSMKAHTYGHYRPGALYVFAHSPGEARELAMDKLRSRLEPDETADRPFKKNYLQNIEKIHVKPRAAAVKDWKDFVKMVQHVATTKDRSYPLLAMDDEDIAIFLRKIRDTSKFNDLLSKTFTDRELKVIRTLYRHVGDNIQHMAPEVKELYDPSLKRELKGLQGREVDVPEEKDDPWGYWSVYEPENGDYDFSDLRTFKDVLAYSKKWGIPKKDLDEQVKDRYASEDAFYDEEVRLYRHLRKEIKVPPGHKAFDGDYLSSYWADRGIHWEEIAHEVATEFSEILGRFNVANNQSDEYGNDKSTGDDNEETELMEWLWEFYQKGFPKKTPPMERYKTVLEEMLEYRRKLKSRKDDDVPF